MRLQRIAHGGKGGDDMYHRYQGDRLGKTDEDGIAEWYPNCKVRKEGEVYVATPHTTNPCRRTVRKPKAVAVSVEDGKYKLADADKSRTSADTFLTTRKEVFDELYDKYSGLKPHERKQAVGEDISGLFPDGDDAKYFVDANWRRKRRNLYSRKKRFEYKAYNQEYQFFFTVTHFYGHYDNRLTSALKSSRMSI